MVQTIEIQLTDLKMLTMEVAVMLVKVQLWLTPVIKQVPVTVKVTSMEVIVAGVELKMSRGQ